jgi:hypothetical protein
MRCDFALIPDNRSFFLSTSAQMNTVSALVCTYRLKITNHENCCYPRSDSWPAPRRTQFAEGAATCNCRIIPFLLRNCRIVRREE